MVEGPGLASLFSTCNDVILFCVSVGIGLMHMFTTFLVSYKILMIDLKQML